MGLRAFEFFSRGIPLGRVCDTGQLSDDDHGSFLAARAAGQIDAGDLKQQVFGRLLWDFWQSRIKFQQFTALSEGLFFGAVGQKAEVTDAHETVGEYVEQEAAPVWRARRRLE